MIRTHATLAFLATAVLAGASEHTPFDPEPDHLWNRVHAAFYVRVAPDGTQYTTEVLDPPLAPMTLYPLTPPAHEMIVALLDDFIETGAATQISDPLKRAIFQRDIWAVFDWTTKMSRAWYSVGGRNHPNERSALQTRLAKIIQQVALTREEIEALPDNYQRAVSSGLFPAAYNPEASQEAFLPPGLTQSPEPWLLLSVDSRPGLIAPEHIGQTMGRSVFLVFCKFPNGLEYLWELRKFPAPWVFGTYYQKFGGSRVFGINPELPQFPAGSQFILLRKTMLVDASGALVLSPLTESVQIRVYPTDPKNDDPTTKPFSQDVYAFELDRDELFKEENGGLRVVKNDDPSLTTIPFGLWPNDGDPLEAEDSEERERFEQMPRMHSCRVCHSHSGIHSVGFYTGNQTMRQRRPPRLNPTDDQTLEALRTMRWKEQQYSWGLLRGLWERR